MKRRSPVPSGPLLGAHVSAAGGSLRALDRAVDLGAESMQLFTRPPSQWKPRAFEADEASSFRARRSALGIFPVLVHDIYLTNLAAPQPEVRARSLQAVVEERLRCAELGVDGLVCHMGASGRSDDEVEGLRRFSASLGEVLERTAGCGVRILLENSAGQGSCLGCRFEHIRDVLDALDGHPDLGVCLDTCHAFAAGYDLSSEEGYHATWEAFDRAIGSGRLAAVHCNDSMRALGSRVDRHAHIGKGQLGLDAFARLLRDDRVQGLPVVIETGEAETMHAVNLDLLRGLRSKTRRRRGPAAAPETAGRHPS